MNRIPAVHKGGSHPRQPCRDAAARRGGHPLLELQRAAGNRAVAGYVAALQRYTVEQNYTFGAAHGQAVLRSQGLRAASGTHVRVTTRLFNGTPAKTTEAYDPAANHGRGSWQPVGRARLVQNPPMRVSQNARLALEDHGQAKVFFVDPALAGAANVSLAAAKAPVRIATTSATITIPASGTRQAPATLTQATVTQSANPANVHEFEDANNEALRLETECHNIAKQLINRDPQTAPTRRAPHGKPRVGEAYHFKARPANYVAPPGGVPEEQAHPFKAGGGQRSFRRIIASLSAFDQNLAQLSETYSMHQAMGAASGKSSAVKAFLPGWGDHSEAVVARDGADRLTLANYNRETEARWVIAHAFREAYRSNQEFRRWFRPWYAQHLRQGVDAGIAADRLAYTLGTFQRELLEQISVHLLAKADAARRAVDSAVRLGGTLWYFDLYGPAAQSFQRRYRVLGARRMSGSVTTAV
jgi:hypothetical protein